MEPISAALLTAIGAALKDKVTGAASEYVMDAVKHAAGRLHGLLPDGDAKKAQALIDHVMAEAAAYPPDRAIYVESIPSVGTVGIWPPRGSLALNLLWVNRADFPIRIRDLKVKVRAGSGHNEWEISKGDEFVLRPRSDTTRILRGEPTLELPKFDRGGGTCEITVHALVSGPWEHGLAQRSHELYSGTMWVPVYLDQPELFGDEKDVDLVIKHFLAKHNNGDQLKVPYAAFDREHGLRPGSARARFEAVAKAAKHIVEAGPNLAIVEIRDPDPIGVPMRGYVGDDGGWQDF
jgi:hypothetical protein